jgi:hypothetical protein
VRWSERIERGERKTTRAIALATALLSFSIRFYWTMKVQNPLSALYSDMGGYYSRAIDMLDGQIHGDPRGYAFFPWGAHALVGMELYAVGRHSQLGVAIVQSVLGTVPAVCTVFFTARVVRSRFWIVAAGVAAAIWQPSVVHTGFFMSELWYSAFLVAGTLYFLRFLEGKTGAFRAGALLAVAIVVRPQALLTFAIVGGVLVLAAVVRRFTISKPPPTTVRNWVRFFVPIALMLAFSANRYHKYTGHWGLVSENGPINRAFGATHLGRIEAYWWYNGGRYGAWYTPPAKSPVRQEDMIVFEGYIGEEKLLDQIREEHVKRETRWQRVKRAHRNIKLLIYRFIFPEDDFAANGQHPNRAFLQHAFRLILVNILPVGFFGLFAMLMTKRQRLIGMLFAAHAVTLLVVAALYFAEARMRMPYDPFLLASAAAGCSAFVALMQKLYHLILEKLDERDVKRAKESGGEIATSN